MQKAITKAVIPAAGWGTRFLPQTKAVPKEMLPIVDKPVIQYVVEEAVRSGLKEIIIITAPQKRAIEEHFSASPALEEYLRNSGKEKELEQILQIPKLADFSFIRQDGQAYGNAVPVMLAEKKVGNEFFSVLWGDEFIWADPPRLSQMIKVHEKYGGGVISAVRIEDRASLCRYGIADVDEVEENVFKIKKIVEKPKSQEAPSNLAAHGAYILPPEIFKAIRNLNPGKGGEIWLVDAINHLIGDGFPFYANTLENARYYDTGNKLEYIKTVVEFALRNPDFGQEFKEFLNRAK